MEPEPQEARRASEAVYEASTPSIGDVSRTETQHSDAVHEALISPLRGNRVTEMEESVAPAPDVRSDEKATGKPRTRYPNVLRNWWLEILCLGVAIAALLAITFTLSTHHNRPLPQWPYKVSVNTLVAVYIVILKAALLLVITEGISALPPW